MNKTILAILCSLALLSPLGNAQTKSKLAASNYMLEDNTLELSYENEVINFMKGTFYPGEGYCEILSQAVEDLPWKIHGLGIALNEDVVQVRDGVYKVKSESSAELTIERQKGKLEMLIGNELFQIRKDKSVFTIEIRPVRSAGIPDSTQLLSYRLSLEPKAEFLGIISHTYQPIHGFSDTGDHDGEANYIPALIRFNNGVLKAEVSRDEALNDLEFSYSYDLAFSQDKDKNFKNLLTLLTQRQRVSYCPLIHPVLLGIYFYDAIMP